MHVAEKHKAKLQTENFIPYIWEASLCKSSIPMITTTKN